MYNKKKIVEGFVHFLTRNTLTLREKSKLGVFEEGYVHFLKKKKEKKREKKRRSIEGIRGERISLFARSLFDLGTGLY